MFLRKYGAAAQVDGIPLITRGAVDYMANPTLDTGDVQISKDGGAFANIEGAGTFGDFVAVAPAGGTSVQVKPDAATMQCKRLVIRFIDQTSPKEWEDQEVIIETFGDPNAQIIGDFNKIGTSGTNSVTITVYEHGTSTPIPDYYIDIYNSDESVFLGTLTSNSMGQITANLNGGTYKLRGRKAQYLPDNTVETFLVDAAHLTMTIYAAPFVVSVPAGPGLQVLYGWVWQLDKSLVSGVKVTAQIAKQTALADAVIVNAKLEDTSDASGYFELQVLKGSKVQVLVGDSYAKTLTVTNDDSKTLASY